MAMRKIDTIHGHGNNRVCKVLLDTEYDEYVVQLHEAGVHRESADYFTNDKGDAVGTAKLMVETPNVVNTVDASWVEWQKPGRLANRKAAGTRR